MTTERYARLAPDSIRRVANEATKQWSDDSKVALGLVNDWSTPNSPYIQVPSIQAKQMEHIDLQPGRASYFHMAFFTTGIRTGAAASGP